MARPSLRVDRERRPGLTLPAPRALLVALVLCLVAGLTAPPPSLLAEARTSNIALVGWQGDATPKASLSSGSVKSAVDEATSDDGPSGSPASPGGSGPGSGAADDNTLPRWVEHLSWEPRASVYHNFLTADECDYLIKVATPVMEASQVVDGSTGEGTASNVRTSSGAFLRRKSDPTIAAIEARIAAWAMVPAENGEGLQILHYTQGQKYEAHFDYFHDAENVKNGGQRVATVLMYLSDVAEGGETVFPGAPLPKQQPEGLSACALKGLAVKPRKGDALLFFSLTTAGEQDPASLHAGCPVISGDKWSATKWMRVGAFSD